MSMINDPNRTGDEIVAEQQFSSHMEEENARLRANLAAAREDAKEWAEKAGRFTADWIMSEKELAASRADVARLRHHIETSIRFIQSMPAGHQERVGLLVIVEKLGEILTATTPSPVDDAHERDAARAEAKEP